MGHLFASPKRRSASSTSERHSVPGVLFRHVRHLLASGERCRVRLLLPQGLFLDSTSKQPQLSLLFETRHADIGAESWCQAIPREVC